MTPKQRAQLRRKLEKKRRARTKALQKERQRLIRSGADPWRPPPPFQLQGGDSPSQAKKKKAPKKAPKLKKLEGVPKETFRPASTRLHLGEMNLDCIPLQAVKMTTLETLSLPINVVAWLPDMTIWKQLRSVNLQCNHLHSLPDSIGSLPNLEILDVSFNRLRSLPNSLGQLTQLKTLYLQSNRLTELPATMAGLESLVQLTLGLNRFEALPDQLRSLTRLGLLQLERNRIDVLPDGVFDAFSSLQELNISFNRLSTIPVLNLPRLSSLNLASNNICRLPLVEIRDCPLLHTLVIDSNPFCSEEIDPLDFSLPLERLDARRCSLQTLPLELLNFPKLRVLNLGHNFLRTMPSYLSKLEDLRHCDLTDNCMEDFPDPEALRHCTQLHLDQNEIQTFTRANMFPFLDKLEVLNIGENFLSRIPSEIAHMTSLVRLRLTENHITSLPSELKHLTRLEELLLAHNCIEALPSEIGHLPLLRVLAIEDNRLDDFPDTLSKCPLSIFTCHSNPLSRLPLALNRSAALFDYIKTRAEGHSHNPKYTPVPKETPALEPTPIPSPADASSPTPATDQPSEQE